MEEKKEKMPATTAPMADFVREITALQRPLYVYIFSLVHNPADADDVLQETNRVIWEKIAEFEPGTNLSAWAYKIAFFEVRTYRKRKGREAGRFSNQLVEQLAEEVELVLEESSPRRQALDACLQKMTDKNRQLVVQRYLQGATVRGLAQKLGRTEKAIYHALSRVRSWLLTCIRNRLAAEGLQ